MNAQPTYTELRESLAPEYLPAIVPIHYVLGQMAEVERKDRDSVLAVEPYYPEGYDGPHNVYVPLKPHYPTREVELTIQWLKEQGHHVRRQQRGAHLYIVEWER